MLEACTGAGEFIQMQSVVGSPPIGPYTLMAHIIGHNQDEVWLFLSLGEEGKESQGKLGDD